MLKQLWIALTNRGVVGTSDTRTPGILNMTGKPVISDARCNGCGACVTACPAAALQMPGKNGSENGSVTPLIAHGRCIGCARCIEACTTKCLAFLPGTDTWYIGGEEEWQPLKIREGK
ncbi:MAG TPA: 4Fe-4S binding protein [Candidatus Ozemobacteraceae bacterium]|nr:4Fe-4S binding protein [Candidatus Ozemobacteraceae bacterium]